MLDFKVPPLLLDDLNLLTKYLDSNLHLAFECQAFSLREHLKPEDLLLLRPLLRLKLPCGLLYLRHKLTLTEPTLLSKG